MTADTKVTVAAKRTLSAHWTDKQVTTFKGNGGTPSSQKTTNTMGTAYGTLPTAAWEDHVFLGWGTAKEGGELVTAESPVTADAKRTLYAQWRDDSGKSVEKPPVVAGFSFGRKGEVPQTLPGTDAFGTVEFEAQAGIVYEIQWTPSLSAEWTTLKRWTAAADGDAEMEIELPPDAPAGFFRITATAAPGGTE